MLPAGYADVAVCWQQQIDSCEPLVEADTTNQRRLPNSTVESALYDFDADIPGGFVLDAGNVLLSDLQGLDLSFADVVIRDPSSNLLRQFAPEDLLLKYTLVEPAGRIVAAGPMLSRQVLPVGEGEYSLYIGYGDNFDPLTSTGVLVDLRYETNPVAVDVSGNDLTELLLEPRSFLGLLTGTVSIDGRDVAENNGLVVCARGPDGESDWSPTRVCAPVEVTDRTGSQGRYELVLPAGYFDVAVCWQQQIDSCAPLAEADTTDTRWLKQSTVESALYEFSADITRGFMTTNNIEIY